MKEKIINTAINAAEWAARLMWAFAIVLILLVISPIILLSLLLEVSAHSDGHWL